MMSEMTQRRTRTSWSCMKLTKVLDLRYVLPAFISSEMQFR
jgi:hypothetical protein